ncbi:MAG: winged helix-turn-helix transcriptional regulator, partial [Nanoarchaeota archaeon]|nr:winged helix-turn-helix transcriptional regulator [Nanoarchaeota archaeon]
MGVLKLDLKDRKILEELDLNARYFISDIAKKVKLNKEVVKYRIHNLEKKGVIQGYHTLINYAKLGLIPVEVSINLMDTRKETVEEMLAFLQAQPNLQSLKLCDVTWDRS